MRRKLTRFGKKEEEVYVEPKNVLFLLHGVMHKVFDKLY